MKNTEFKITRIDKPRESRNTKYKGMYTYIEFWQNNNRKTYHTFVYHVCKNFKNWECVLESGIDTDVTNLKLKIDKERLIDADSKPKVVEKVEELIPEFDL